MIVADDYRQAFGRVPFAFDHDLHDRDVFGFDSLLALARRYAEPDYFVASGAPTPGTPFYDVRQSGATPADAIERLDVEPQRVLLKRPENYDPRFRALLDESFARAIALRGGLGGERVVRLESAIFFNSAAAITPFHFDPEITFFFQIQGSKRYHLYAPANLMEGELERFYVKGIVNIGQVELDRRDPAAEHVFDLVPGRGMHQPQNAPHWVETAGERSISYTFSFETDAMRAVNRTRSFNHYQRRLGLQPSAPGTHPQLDALKSASMRIALPARKAVGRAARFVAKR